MGAPLFCVFESLFRGCSSSIGFSVICQSHSKHGITLINMYLFICEEESIWRVPAFSHTVGLTLFPLSLTVTTESSKRTLVLLSVHRLWLDSRWKGPLSNPTLVMEPVSGKSEQMQKQCGHLGRSSRAAVVTDRELCRWSLLSVSVTCVWHWNADEGPLYSNRAAC